MWHLYPYGLRQEHSGGVIPDALAVFIYDEAETTRAVAEAWAGRFPDTQFSILAVNTGLPAPGQNELEQLVTLINWELAWTGLWHYEHLMLVGIGRGAHIALRLATKCPVCAGVVAVDAAHADTERNLLPAAGVAGPAKAREYAA